MVYFSQVPIESAKQTAAAVEGKSEGEEGELGKGVEGEGVEGEKEGEGEGVEGVEAADDCATSEVVVEMILERMWKFAYSYTINNAVSPEIPAAIYTSQISDLVCVQ